MLKTLMFFSVGLITSYWKPLLYCVIAMVALVFASNAFAGRNVDYAELTDDQAWVEQNKDAFSTGQVQYCTKVIGIGQGAIIMRDEGLTLQHTLNDLDISLNALTKENGMRLDQHVYLELTRMIRTVYRHPKMDKSAYHKQFYAECMALGGY